ncbi:hypothetical protein ACULMG_13495 [Xanthomonas arboricola pv. corylina]|uniref:hypothetical protein n=1 Tax=Xanthomonas arboricola TaxID=56448 RepID=UPI004040A0A0
MNTAVSDLNKPLNQQALHSTRTDVGDNDDSTASATSIPALQPSQVPKALQDTAGQQKSRLMAGSSSRAETLAVAGSRWWAVQGSNL